MTNPNLSAIPVDAKARYILIDRIIPAESTFRDKDSGENREKTEWNTVAVFSEGLVKVCEQYLKKGSSVYIEDKLQTRKWQDQSGNDRYSTEVVLQGFDSKLVMLGGSQGGGNASSGPVDHNAIGSDAGGGYGSQGNAMDDDGFDEIPFHAEFR